MKVNTKFTKLVAGAALAIATVAGISSTATAGAAYEREYTYYDANGGYIGTKLYTCDGGVYRSGQTSSNYDVLLVPCEDF